MSLLAELNEYYWLNVLRNVCSSEIPAKLANKVICLHSQGVDNRRKKLFFILLTFYEVTSFSEVIFKKADFKPNDDFLKEQY